MFKLNIKLISDLIGPVNLKKKPRVANRPQCVKQLANEGQTHKNTVGTRDYMSGAGHEEKGCTCHINTGSLKSKKMGMILKLLTTNNSLGHSVVMHTYKGT